MLVFDMVRKAKEIDIDVNNALNCRIRYLTDRLWDIGEEKENYCELITDNDWSIALFLNRIAAANKEKVEIRKEIHAIKSITANIEGITAADIEQAKMYPIGRLIDFSKGKALCLWHVDKNPSLHWYRQNNKVKCFACGKSGDSIDVHMQQTGVDFITAVRQLFWELYT